MRIGCHLLPWNHVLQEHGFLSQEADKVLNWLREAGFYGIEMGAHFIPEGKEQAVNEVLQSHGLKFEAAHMGVPYFTDAFTDDHMTFLLQKMERLKHAGANRVLFSTWGDQQSDVSRLADHVQALGEKAAEHQLSFSYHNHDHEFKGEQTLIRQLLAETSAAYVSVALDVGWVFRAGTDPADFMAEFRERISYVHLRDVRQNRFVEMGEGEMDIPALFAAMEGYVETATLEAEWGEAYSGTFSSVEASVRASLAYLETLKK
ncbi:sugar phosphate isomerase/epimerase [Thalassobacillus sp. CUG 92003]|uniref:sugar phosphate isomerase/epimerase family protein n=1 Tax=Thalassobacillus sp. CUG 92003 TaxID=2736641 RepID=UPI0015E745CB|nr:sugar phosphate isomerase/epimerase [Thalassobacillus sp. CUG 92003]